MAEAPSGGGEKTEAPTPKRLEDSSKKGDVLQSKELAGALVILAGTGFFFLTGHSLVSALSQLLTHGLDFQAADIHDFNPGERSARLIADIALPLGAFFVVTICAALAGPVLLGSFGFRMSAMKPKPEKLNPFSGLKRMFGTQGLTELGKSLAKVILLGLIGLWLIYLNLPDMFALGAQDIRMAISQFGNLFLMILAVMCVGFFAIAGIDVPVQILRRTKKLRMTKQEVKDEHKQTEGSPEAKAAQRARRMQMLSGSARKGVEEAAVVLTNPTHFAIALKYTPGTDPAPTVVARGHDEIAAAIREFADEMDVPVLEYPELTRAIYFTTPLHRTVDDRLFVAVATILAFIFRLDAELAEKSDRPYVVTPHELRFGSDGNPLND